MRQFTGFPPAALEFYAGIALNNDKAWFEAHRDDFMAHVIGPAAAFIETLGPRLQALSPGVGFDPNHTGRGSFKKIHTDQRFQKGRDPFKTYAQMIFWKGPLPQKKANAVYTVHFEPEKVVVAGGLIYFDGKVVKAYREAAVDPTHGGRLTEIAAALSADGYAIGGSHYKNVPRGYDPQHPNAALLKHNALFAWHEEAVPPVFHRAEFVDWCVDHFARLTPLFHWTVALLERSAAS